MNIVISINSPICRLRSFTPVAGLELIRKEVTIRYGFLPLCACICEGSFLARDRLVSITWFDSDHLKLEGNVLNTIGSKNTLKTFRPMLKFRSTDYLSKTLLSLISVSLFFLVL